MTDDHKAEAVREAMIDSIAGGTVGVPGGYASLEQDDAVNIVDAFLARFNVAEPESARSALADAWDEGMRAGDADRYFDRAESDNPYRTETP